MSSPPGTPKKKMSQTISFVRNTNPEILRISPRAGGVVKIPTLTPKVVRVEDDVFGVEKEFQAHIEEKVSKEFRVQTALDETRSLDSEDVTMSNPAKDAMYMIGVALSSIMMMANDQKLSSEHLDWTTRCLECIKDDFGNHPPNVQGILNHLKFLNRGGNGGGGSPPPPEPTAGDEGDANKEDQGDANKEDEGEAKEDEGEAKEDEELGEQTIRSTTRVRMGSKDG